MAPRGALGQVAKHSARIEHRSLSPGLDARSLTVFELAGLRPPLERIGISPHPLVPYPWDSSFSLGRWAQAEEAELIGGGAGSLGRGDCGYDLEGEDLFWIGWGWGGGVGTLDCDFPCAPFPG